MYKCPKCHSEMDKNELKCNNCRFILKISLKDYEKRETELYDYNLVKFLEKKGYISQLLKYLESDEYKEEIINFKVSKDEFDVLIYKMISYIYLDYFYPRNKFNNNIKDLLNGYRDEYKDNYSELIQNLNDLKKLLGFPTFNKKYMNKLLQNNLHQNKGMEIYGYLISDILEENLKSEDFESKLEEYIIKYKENENFHVTKKDKKIQKKLKKYYKITGKHYFSKRFDILINKYNLSLDNAFNVKKKLLNDIYNENRPNLYKNFEKYVHYEITNKDKPVITRRLGSETDDEDMELERESYGLGKYGKIIDIK